MIEVDVGIVVVVEGSVEGKIEVFFRFDFVVIVKFLCIC